MKKKSRLYKVLTKTLGNPLNMNAKQRDKVLILLGGWFLQAKGKRLSGHPAYWIPAKPSPKFEKQSAFNKHAEKSEAVFNQSIPGMLWKIRAYARRPDNKALANLIGEPTELNSVPKNAPLSWVGKDFMKRLNITIPVTYHKRVPEDIRWVGRKAVQDVWNHRVYSDKEVWECNYFDFSVLTRDENSYNNVKWSHGYIVKMDIAVVLEPSLEKALSKAHSLTIQRVVRSIESDDETA